MSEPTFLQLWLAGAFSHVDGDLDFYNADDSANITTSTYAEITDFIETHGEVYVDLVPDRIAGFALRFPADHPVAIRNQSFIIWAGQVRYEVFLCDDTDDNIRALLKELEPTEDDVYSIESIIPLPINDFDLDAESEASIENGFQVFTVTELMDQFFGPVEEPTVIEYDYDNPTEIINDAKVYGVISDELAKLPIVLSVAKHSQEKEWKTQEPAPFLNVFTGVFSTHKEGKKEGNSFITGALGPSKKRTKTNVLAGYMLGLDVDNGSSMHDTFAKVRKANLTAIFYTTHSHGTTKIEVAYDKWHKWASRNSYDPDNPTTPLIRKYLKEDTSYVDAVTDHAEYVEKVHEDGLKLLIQTPPIDKFRMIFPLKRPYVYKDQPGEHRKVIEAWSAKALGLGRRSGVEIDRAARDPSRLFYLPRHAKGKTITKFS